jgi:hypothetical protein
MTTPIVTEMDATKKAKRSELRKRVGNVAGMLIWRALTQLASVKWPLGATGESDQKLPKTRAQIGKKIIRPRITRRIASKIHMALERYMAEPEEFQAFLA